MEKFYVGLCAALYLCVFFSANLSSGTPLLGAKQCTWGPSYWCKNITNAKGCNAVRHCIQTVWEKQNVPVDNDSICKICKDMVTQARDQLRSNETMEELREVFEGSCKLIPIKVVNKECCKLADDFIPELVEALSSEMNPDQVCSVAGLCNNVEIDQLLMSYYSGALEGTLTEEPSTSTNVPMIPSTKTHPLSCGNCQSVASLITKKFGETNRDDVLENILHVCGQMSTFSDACSNIAITYFNDIYENLKNNLHSVGLCHISGACYSKYHEHPEDISNDDSLLAMADLNGDDIPCELCQQLVHHLRDMLVANTTETEFKQVLEGLCKQTQGFKTECLSIVDQYYDMIYKTLVNNLDANGACFLIGVCPKGKNALLENGIMPLLPVIPPAEVKISIKKKLEADEPVFSVNEIHGMTIPIDHLMGAANPGLFIANAQLCTLCEFALHFIQDELSLPANEEEVKKEVNSACNKMPGSIRGKCHDFVDMYGDAVIALIVQGLDPRDVCPKMEVCPHNINHNDVEVFAAEPVEDDFGMIVDSGENSDKPTCPLCIFAVEQAQAKIKNDKSKQNIKNVLDHLCSHLPSKLQVECVDFVNTYSNELIDMLISDFKSQEICVALKLCPKTNSYLSDLGISFEDYNSKEDTTNEIPDENGMPVEIKFGKHDESAAPNCLLCEEVVKIAEKRIGKHATKDDIKKALDQSCDKMRTNLRAKCHKYMDRYGDKIASLLLKEMEPKTICREIGLCLWSEMENLDIDEALKYNIIVNPNTYDKSEWTGGNKIAAIIQDPPSCVLCEFVMTKLEADLRNKTTQDEIKHAIQSVCNHMPKTVLHSCINFVDQYGNTIISLIDTVPPKKICQKLQLCLAANTLVVNDAIIECGVCHAATMSLYSYLKDHSDLSTIAMHDMLSIACESLPAKYFDICTEMVSVYGQSILHLYRKDTNEISICSTIGKCYANEKSSFAFAILSA